MSLRFLWFPGDLPFQNHGCLCSFLLICPSKHPFTILSFIRSFIHSPLMYQALLEALELCETTSLMNDSQFWDCLSILPLSLFHTTWAPKSEFTFSPHFSPNHLCKGFLCVGFPEFLNI